MRINIIGGGPGGLYAAILLKKQIPDASIQVFERNGKDSTFGFGIVLSVETLGRLKEADAESCADIQSKFTYWDDLYVWFKGQSLRSTGHGFSGLERLSLLNILQDRAQALGVDCHWNCNISDLETMRDADLVIASDGVNSLVRAQYGEHFQPSIDMRPNKFVWLGSSIPLAGFTFIFKENEHGQWVVHSYQYKPGRSTFVVETTPETFQRAGLNDDDEGATVAYVRKLFREELEGHTLETNKSVWRQFPVVRCGRWHHDNMVLIGDAAHTAHYSIGSGTKLAMEDAIALAQCLQGKWSDVPAALAAFERERRPKAEKIQRAAEISLRWFEGMKRYWALSPEIFNFSLLTRSKQITYDNLRVRDPEFVGEIDAILSNGHRAGTGMPNSPVETPFALGGLHLRNRLVSVVDGVGAVAASGMAAQAPVARPDLLLLAPVESGRVLPKESMAAAVQKARRQASHVGVGLRLPADSSADTETEDLLRAVRQLAALPIEVLELDVCDHPAAAVDPVLNLLKKVRATWPSERALALRLSVAMPDHTALAIAAAARDVGVALVHVRLNAQAVGGADSTEESLPLLNLAEQIKLDLGTSVLVSGGVRSDDERNTAVAASRVDLVGIEAVAP